MAISQCSDSLPHEHRSWVSFALPFIPRTLHNVCTGFNFTSCTTQVTCLIVRNACVTAPGQSSRCAVDALSNSSELGLYDPSVL